jgi:hypothetical protein
MGRGSQPAKSRKRRRGWVNGHAKDTGRAPLGRSIFRECHDRFGVVTWKGEKRPFLTDVFEVLLGIEAHKGSGSLVHELDPLGITCFIDLVRRQIIICPQCSIHQIVIVHGLIWGVDQVRKAQQVTEFMRQCFP